MDAIRQANLPLLAIPAYYILTVYPHVHSIAIANKGNFSQHDNRNPQSTQSTESIKRRLTAREFAAYERARRCHANSLENWPIFIAAVFAGLLAEQQGGAGRVGLTKFVAGWTVVRALYTANYLMTETLQWSYLRSLLFNIGAGWALWTIGRAAFVIGR